MPYNPFYRRSTPVVADNPDRWDARLAAMDAAYAARMGLYPPRSQWTATDFGVQPNETPGYRSAAMAAPPPAPPPPSGQSPQEAELISAGVYKPMVGSPAPQILPQQQPQAPPSYPGGGSFAQTGAGPYSSPDTLPSQLAQAPIPPQRPDFAPGNESPGYRASLAGSPPPLVKVPLPPSRPDFAPGNESPGYRASLGGTTPAPTPGGPGYHAGDSAGPYAPPTTAPVPSPAAVRAALSPAKQNVPVPPARPTAALAPVQAPIPSPAGRWGGASPAAVPQPPVTHVSGPAWLGAFFRAGQQAPTGMSAMVDRRISDVGGNR